jgi:hypothetical protein
VNADPKLLSVILQITGWKACALAGAGALFLLLIRLGILNPVSSGTKQLIQIAVFVGVALTLANLLEYFAVGKRFAHWRRRVEVRREVREYLPQMTQRERDIVAYLLAHNQTVFPSDADGGYARTLISKGIVVSALRPGQVLPSDHDYPFMIPSHVWTKVLVPHKSQFPYTPPADGTVVHPWRQHPWTR